MKTSQKEGVSDRPPTPVTCPDTRHRSSTAAVGVTFGAIGRRTSLFGHSRCSHSAPPPPMPRIASLAIVVDVETGVTNGFLSHRPSSLHSLTTGYAQRLCRRRRG